MGSSLVSALGNRPNLLQQIYLQQWCSAILSALGHVTDSAVLTTSLLLYRCLDGFPSQVRCNDCSIHTSWSL
jgi:hypothetical protein